VPDTDVERAAAKSARCVHHPALPSAAPCDLCGEPLCLTCAVPVRGNTIGPECLGRVLEDSPHPVPTPTPVRPRTDALAVAGFGLVLLLSIVPWNFHSDTAGLFRAWTLHWSLLAVLGAAAGLAVSIAIRRHPRDLRLEAALQVGLALVVAGAALLHFQRPPVASSPSAAPIFAMVGAGLAAVSGLAKAAAFARLRRGR
jgi:hypothetical protein